MYFLVGGRSPFLIVIHISTFCAPTPQERNKRTWKPMWAPSRAKTFASLRLEILLFRNEKQVCLRIVSSNTIPDVFIFRCCCKRITTQWLETTQIYYLKVRRLASNMGLAGLKSMGQQGCVSFWRLQGIIHFLFFSSFQKPSGIP